MGSNFDDTMLLSYSDAQIIDYITSVPRLPNASNITPLSSEYLAKGYLKDEIEDATRSVEFASQLGIQVPPIRRIIQAEYSFYCIIDRIPGRALDAQWPELGWIASLRLAFQLRRMLYRMRAIESSSAGSLATGKCRSNYLDDLCGLPPRANSSQVNALMNFWAKFITPRQEIKKTPAEHATCPRPIFSSNRPFVFTHHDLAPRNIILDDQGQLWLIDWDEAGFYPKFFEYTAMYNFIPSHGWNKLALWRWKLFAWIAGGFYDKKSEIIRSRFTRFRPARRFNIKANGYAAIAGRPDNDQAMLRDESRALVAREYLVRNNVFSMATVHCLYQPNVRYSDGPRSSQPRLLLAPEASVTSNVFRYH